MKWDQTVGNDESEREAKEKTKRKINKRQSNKKFDIPSWQQKHTASISKCRKFRIIQCVNANHLTDQSNPGVQINWDLLSRSAPAHKQENEYKKI